MDVLFHLKELLKSRKTVGIAGLGTLYKKKSPGKYDVKKHSFLPPSYTLSFKNEVNEPDEFASHIAEVENIGIDLAKTQIAEFVEKLNTQLGNQLQAKLEGIGKFISINKELTFIPDEENIFEKEFYGFPNLADLIKPADKEENAPTPLDVKDESDSSEKINPIVNSEPVLNIAKPEIKTPIENTPYIPNEEYADDDDSDGGMSKGLKYLLGVLIIAAIIGLVYFFKPDIFKNIFKTSDIETISVPEKTESNLPVGPINNIIDSLDIDTNEAKKLDSMLVVLPKQEIIETNITTYEVIGGAVKSQKKIDLVINTMKKKRIAAKALEKVPGRLVKISLGSFTDFNLAKKHQDSLRKILKNPEIYIHTIKPKNNT